MYYHNKKIGSPGYELELKFNRVLNEFLPTLNSKDGYCYIHTWMSQNKKTPYDFVVEKIEGFETKEFTFIDVVGIYPNLSRPRLITHQKDWARLHDYAEKYSHGAPFKEYLAFMYRGSWHFYLIKGTEPYYDLYLSKSAMRGIRDIDFIFRDRRNIKTRLVDSIKGMYAPRTKKEDILNSWIYTDVRV